MGIREVLNGSATLDDVIWTDPATNFKFVPNVVRSRTAHTNEILSSDEMKRFIDTARIRKRPRARQFRRSLRAGALVRALPWSHPFRFVRPFAEGTG